ncbi:hypothetical protein KOW79_000983 [Hemibagrus wyckioides]|uniref:Uncharacterized protein n=1 Tax=Hemibagrus wyckioides TaxID=337641 RepID=A0A9D3SVB1_9TELE|nr:hypothetical protein KOW79_000983 [Hemibagrus wyckioides]
MLSLLSPLLRCRCAAAPLSAGRCFTLLGQPSSPPSRRRQSSASATAVGCRRLAAASAGTLPSLLLTQCRRLDPVASSVIAAISQPLVVRFGRAAAVTVGRWLATQPLPSAGPARAPLPLLSLAGLPLPVARWAAASQPVCRCFTGHVALLQLAIVAARQQMPPSQPAPHELPLPSRRRHTLPFVVCRSCSVALSAGVAMPR